MSGGAAETMEELKRRLAATLVRSRLNYLDDLQVLTKLFGGRPKSAVDAAAAKVRSLWSERLDGRTPGQLYVHVPFCRKRCSFCVYAVAVADGAFRSAAYVDELLEEAASLAPAFSGSRFGSVFVGGGTPSVLEAADLRRLFERLESLYEIAPGAARHAEFHPASATKAKLRALRDAGFGYVSFGVQSFDAGLLRRIGREAHGPSVVARAIGAARALGFGEVNADLIYGLAGDTPERFAAGLKALAAMGPTTISIRPLTLTEAYLRAEALDPKSFERQLGAAVEAQAPSLTRLAGELGYETDRHAPQLGCWGLVLCRKDRPAALREAWAAAAASFSRPPWMLGLGRLAESYASGGFRYARGGTRFRPDRPGYQVALLDRQEEIGAFVLSSVKTLSRVSLDEFRRMFGRDIRDELGTELRLLKALGKIRLEDGELRFLPSRRSERFFFGSMLFLSILDRQPFSALGLGGEFGSRVRRALQGVELS